MTSCRYLGQQNSSNFVPDSHSFDNTFSKGIITMLWSEESWILEDRTALRTCKVTDEIFYPVAPKKATATRSTAPQTEK